MLHKWKATQVVTKQLSLPLLAWQASPKANSTGHYLELLLKQKSNDNNLLLWRVVGEWLMTVALRKSPSRINERLFTYRGNPFSPFLICRKKPICLWPAKCMKRKSQPCPCPGSEFTRSWAQTRVSYGKGHTTQTHRAQMYYDHLFLPHLTCNITHRPFISFSCVQHH